MGLYKTMCLYAGGGLINRVIIKLRTAWAYKRGAYTRGRLIYGILRYSFREGKKC